MKTLNSQSEVAGLVGKSAGLISKWMDNPTFRKQCVKRGKFDAEACLRWSVGQDKKVAAQMGGGESVGSGPSLVDLRRKSLYEKIKQDEIRLEMLKRENETHKREHEAKSGDWYHKQDFVDFARLMVGVLDSGIRAVEMITHDQHVVDAVTAEFNRARVVAVQAIKKAQTKDASPK